MVTHALGKVTSSYVNLLGLVVPYWSLFCMHFSFIYACFFLLEGQILYLIRYFVLAEGNFILYTSVFCVCL